MNALGCSASIADSFWGFKIIAFELQIVILSSNLSFCPLRLCIPNFDDVMMSVYNTGYVLNSKGVATF
jgi:hypothetical protein